MVASLAPSDSSLHHSRNCHHAATMGHRHITASYHTPPNVHMATKRAGCTPNAQSISLRTWTKSGRDDRAKMPPPTKLHSQTRKKKQIQPEHQNVALSSELSYEEDIFMGEGEERMEKQMSLFLYQCHHEGCFLWH